jgi:hypothetical protein
LAGDSTMTRCDMLTLYFINTSINFIYALESYIKIISIK